MLSTPAVHSHLAALAALSAPHENCAAVAVKVALGQRHVSLIRSPARHNTTISPRSLTPSMRSPAARMTAMISSTDGGSAGYRKPLLRGGRPR
ncbi:MAG: hypothetical protein ACTHQQ_23930 [Solirubrobacteraceae bacterium]